MLLFHAQYLNAQGHAVAERAVFAADIQRAYELALAAAANPIQAISAAWVTIKEDPELFEKTEGKYDVWASPFKPTPVLPIPQFAFDALGRVIPHDG